MQRRLIELSALLRAIPLAVAFYQGSPSLAVQRAFRVWWREGIGGIRRRVAILLGGLKSGPGAHRRAIDLYGDLPAANPEFSPRVSIIVPNYNHAPYLRQRLESIYQQTYQNIEVILLDDRSSDASVEILREFARRFSDRTVCKFNDSNSGSVFCQWKNGLKAATGELVWIAESDDFCTENFLAEQVRAFQNPGVTLSFCKTEFVTGDPAVKVWSLDEYLSDFRIADWNRSFIRSAHSLVCAGWGVKNIVPNVSGALFRHPRNLPLLNDQSWLGLRMCGDWVFYLSIIRGGLVAYTPAATNYYRQHRLNTSVNTQREDLYYKEHEVVAQYLAKLFHLKRGDLEGQEQDLYGHWCRNRGKSRASEFRALYDLDRVFDTVTARKPNVAMVVYALAAGGGETFPLMLANLLQVRGYAVTVLNARQEVTEPGVREMLSRRIPLLELDSFELAGAALADMGIEVVHSHHAWVDATLAMLLRGEPNVRHVLTTHGMYEMMEPPQVQALLPLLTHRVDRVVYTAEKNLSAFPPAFREEKKFSKIHNALPSCKVEALSRKELGLDEHDFVLCLVARAIPEKGWAEAIEAVAWANERSRRRIHLLLIGDGSEFRRLKPQTFYEFVHFLGFQPNIRDYFAASDVGFLPTRFKGESAPLVLIDCLLSGKPLIASDIGEIREMLEAGDGLAGQLFDLVDWEVDIETVGRIILTLAEDHFAYRRLLHRVPMAAAKFEISTMVEKYERIYEDVVACAIRNESDDVKCMGGRC